MVCAGVDFVCEGLAFGLGDVFVFVVVVRGLTLVFAFWAKATVASPRTNAMLKIPLFMMCSSVAVNSSRKESSGPLIKSRQFTQSIAAL